jgi:hypothetical protein
MVLEMLLFIMRSVQIEGSLEAQVDPSSKKGTEAKLRAGALAPLDQANAR